MEITKQEKLKKEIEYKAIVNYVLGYLGLNPTFKRVDEAINSFLKRGD